MMRETDQPSVDLIGVPLDLGVAELGLKIGPDAFRETGLLEIAGWAKVDIHDHGDMNIEPVPETKDSQFRNVQSIARACENIAEKVSESIAADRIPVCLGGDHSLAIGSIAGAARVLGNIGCIWIDAHPDANTPETSPSGNIHGMPVAIILGHGPKELVDHLAPSGAKVAYERMSLLGCRDIDPGEEAFIGRHGVQMFTVFDVVEQGLAHVVGETIKRTCEGTDGVHVSLDLDALREEVAPGVGLRSSCGFDMREISYVVEQIAEQGKITSIDIVGLNPVRDREHRTAMVGIELLMTLLGRHLSCSYYNYIRQQSRNGKRK